MAVGKRKKAPDKGGESVVKFCLGKHLKAKQTIDHIQIFVENSLAECADDSDEEGRPAPL